MTRIDRVMELLVQQDKKGVDGISAQQIALELGIHRSDASADLNKLFKQQRVDKIGVRPVLYQLKKADALLAEPTVETETENSAVDSASWGLSVMMAVSRLRLNWPKRRLSIRPMDCIL